ncbi:MAG: methyltransferase domain-containing protein [Acidimicrobiia bacterium]|nr:methyltransferase domain-containing protein [Acidimicrobiia bacterium]
MRSPVGATLVTLAALAVPPLRSAPPTPAPGPALQTPNPLRRPDVVYVPMPDNLVVALLRLAQVTPRDVVYDLGSGDGRIPIAAAKLFGARAVGIEIEANLIRRSHDALNKAGVADRVVFLHQDLFESDISRATVVTLFLNPGVNQKLMPKLQRELRPGTRVVSLSFDMGDLWPPDHIQDVDGLKMFLWTIR